MPEADPRWRRAVSDVISFTLIFALITATIGIVYVSGFTGLQDTRDAERITNAERAFDVLADNIADIHREAAPSRATEIKVASAQMEFGDPVRVTLEITNYGGTGASTSSVALDPIVYAADETELVYSNGAVFRVDRGGAVLNRRPAILFTREGSEKTVVFPTIETRKDGPASTGSQRTVLVRTLLATREVTVAQADPTATASTVTADPDGDGTDETVADADGDGNDEFLVDIRIGTTPKRAPLWKEYFEAEIPPGPDSDNDFDALDVDGDGDDPDDAPCELLDTDGDGAAETVHCVVAAENVYATVSRIDVKYN